MGLQFYVRETIAHSLCAIMLPLFRFDTLWGGFYIL
jgi:hypothetical protein